MRESARVATGAIAGAGILAAMISFSGPVFDVAAQYRTVGAATTALRAKDWPGVTAAFTEASAYERHLIIEQAGEVNRIEDHLRDTLRANPRDLLAAAMLAQRYVALAWKARGHGYADRVSAQAAETFHRHLRDAEQLMIKACAQGPGFPQAWAVRLQTATGLSVGAVEIRRRYDHLAAQSPNDLYAQLATLEPLLPKWYGSWEMAHDFVWECVNAAPPGSPNGALVVAYYVERLISKDVSGADELFREPQVRHEIASAAQRSVRSATFTGAPGWIIALSHFALIYSLMGDWPAAKDCFTRLGPNASEEGWKYFGLTARAVFNDARQEAMSKG